MSGTNKKGLQLEGPFYINSKLFISYLSSWIANFGVVPLFLLAAFLLVPILAFLLALLFFVILVFETISELLYIKFKNYIFFSNLNSKDNYLPLRASTVKNLLILCGFFNISNGYASVTYRNHIDQLPQHIVISTGSHHQIKSKSINKFSVANSEILEHKFYPDKGLLLLKGKMKGFSEVLTWSATQEITKYHIYVLSKKEHADILHLGQTLKRIKLTFRLEGKALHVSGKLKRLEDYSLFQKILKEHPNRIISNVTLSKKLKNEVTAKVYSYFYKEGLYEISCAPKKEKMICEYPDGLTPSASILAHLKKEYSIKFLKLKDHVKTKNYFLKIKLIQIENLEGVDFSLGLNQLSANLEDLFSNGIQSLINSNNILINQSKYHISTLAQPQTHIQMNTPVHIEVGAQIPYQSVSSTQVVSQTTWKFAGLKLKINIKDIGESYLIKYETEFTKPQGNSGSIVGSKEKASAVINLNEPLELFQIGYQTSSEQDSSIPFISKVPLLGNIFSSKSKKSTYKKITALVHLTRK